MAVTRAPAATTSATASPGPQPISSRCAPGFGSSRPTSQRLRRPFCIVMTQPAARPPRPWGWANWFLKLMEPPKYFMYT